MISLICPQSGIGPDIPPASVLLDANAVRAYLDSVHGPHDVLPPQSPQLTYPQSPLQQLMPSKQVIEVSAERIPERDMRRHNNRKSLFAVTSTVRPSDPSTTLPPSTVLKLHTQRPQLMSALKRQASHGSIVGSNDSLKVFLTYID
jgi:hypothetical protein